MVSPENSFIQLRHGAAHRLVSTTLPGATLAIMISLDASIAVTTERIVTLPIPNNGLRTELMVNLHLLYLHYIQGWNGSVKYVATGF